MSEYSLSNLNDKEFEALVVDLLSAEMSTRIERFKPGPDQGVDGRFHNTDGGEVIIQAKHWQKSGLKSLLNHLEKSEKQKADKLSPSRYILATSVELSRKNKSTIQELYTPWIKSQSDVVGNEDICLLLDKHEKVFRRHYKLWITSEQVLGLIFNAAIIGRSDSYFNYIQERTRIYVPLSFHDKAIEQLDNRHVIIITGEKGIGKTTLANQMAMLHKANGFEFVQIQNSLTEAESAWNNTRKQLFYFDDFLGRNFLEALDKHEDSHVVNFIRRISKDEKKRFILTSRTTILKQGWALSDAFSSTHLDRETFELRVSKVTKYEKGLILYNHLWFSELTSSLIDVVYYEKRYLKIIKHPNFNPRLIEFITDIKRIPDGKEDGYWDFIVNALDNPEIIWQNVFENQINEISRWMLLAVVFNGGSIQEDELKSAYLRSLNKNSENSITTQDHLAYDKSLRVAVGSVLDRSVGIIAAPKDQAIIGLFNPSVGDYIINRFSGDAELITDTLIGLITHKSVSNLKSLAQSGKLTHQGFERVINVLFAYSQSMCGAANVEYIITVGLVSVENNLLSEENKSLFSQFLDKIYDSIDYVSCWDNLFDLLFWAIQNEPISTSEIKPERFIRECLKCSLTDRDLDSLKSLLDLIDKPASDEFVDEFRDQITTYWTDNASELLYNLQVLEECRDPDDLTNTEDIFLEKVNVFLKDEYDIDFNREELCDIISKVDLVDEINDWYSNYVDDDYEGRGSAGAATQTDTDDAIDDLFQR